MSTVTTRIPSYRRHKPTEQAVVTLNGKDIYLGRYGSAASKTEYNRLIAEWLAFGGTAHLHFDELTVVKLMAHYWLHVRRHYVRNARPTNEQYSIKIALRFVGEFYGPTPAVQFGPLALKAVRHKMIDASWCRTTINSSVGRIRRMLRWAASEELLPVTAFQALTTVQGLQAVQTDAIEPTPVGPVADTVVEVTLPYLPSVVADMVRFQRLTGCRPQEVCIVHPRDLDTSPDTAPR